MVIQNSVQSNKFTIYISKKCNKKYWVHPYHMPHNELK